MEGNTPGSGRRATSHDISSPFSKASCRSMTRWIALTPGPGTECWLLSSSSTRFWTLQTLCLASNRPRMARLTSCNGWRTTPGSLHKPSRRASSGGKSLSNSIMLPTPQSSSSSTTPSILLHMLANRSWGRFRKSPFLQVMGSRRTAWEAFWWTSCRLPGPFAKGSTWLEEPKGNSWS